MGVLSLNKPQHSRVYLTKKEMSIPIAPVIKCNTVDTFQFNTDGGNPKQRGDSVYEG